MMPNDAASHEPSVSTWLHVLKAGDSAAANPLWQRYVRQLVRLARQKLGGAPRRAADEEDVVLSALDGFLRGAQQGRFAKLDDRDDLWQVLVMLTERKAIALRRREQAIRRGGGKVRGQSALAGPASESEACGFQQAEGQEPTPAFAAEMAEELGQRLDGLEDEAQRSIVLGKLEG